VTDVLISSLFFTDRYEHSHFGNFKKKFQIIHFVQESFEYVAVQLDTFPCIVFFLYIYTVATYSIVHANVVGSFSKFKLILALPNFYLCPIVLYYIVNNTI
jgi:hypothetical protein